MGPIITDLSHQKTHILSLYLLVVVIKKKKKRREGEDKAENDTKQINK